MSGHNTLHNLAAKFPFSMLMPLHLVILQLVDRNIFIADLVNFCRLDIYVHFLPLGCYLYCFHVFMSMSELNQTASLIISCHILLFWGISYCLTLCEEIWKTKNHKSVFCKCHMRTFNTLHSNVDTHSTTCHLVCDAVKMVGNLICHHVMS